MDTVNKKSLKASKRKEKDLSKKIKNLTKQGRLEEELSVFETEENTQENHIDVKNDTPDNVIDEIKVKKSKSKNKKSLPLDVVDDNLMEVSETINPTDTLDTTESINVIKSDNSLNCAIILNLPADATREELSNFLSKRDIPVDSINIDNGKYVVIESEDSNVLEQIQALIATNPLTNCSDMKVSALTGNPTRLAAFCQRNSIFNKNIVIVKNINATSNITDVLSLLPPAAEVKSHSSTKLHYKKAKTQMLTIEFVSPTHTDAVVAALNNAFLDKHKLTAEFKHKLVEDNVLETKSLTLLLKDLPDTTDYQTIKDLELACIKIELVKKSAKRMCFLTFKTEKDVTEAFEKLSTIEIGGQKVSVKFVGGAADRSMDDLDKTKIHVTNLPYTCTKEDMEKEFDMAQTVKFPTNASGKSKGCCYLSFASVELAALAKEALDEKLIGGRKIKCTYAPVSTYDASDEKKGKRGKKGKTIKKEANVVTLFNLPKTVTVEEIKPKFKNVQLIHIVKKTGDTFKGIAEIHFTDSKYATAVAEGPEITIGGRKIRMELKGGKWREGTKKTRGKKNKKVKEVKADAVKETVDE